MMYNELVKRIIQAEGDERTWKIYLTSVVSTSWLDWNSDLRLEGEETRLLKTGKSARSVQPWIQQVRCVENTVTLHL